ncbi:Fic family protein [Serratia sp. DD3]|uniref:Fic family protein n=1 Tax=Serratia sp. DD3 TaxID=1410619 RepID=UPI0004D6BBC6|nr:Fic family protein [Serratia sp. DD3]KEY57304.1 adenosine monophosphate-protein transferase SoFic [Serratia sp. DD3]
MIKKTPKQDALYESISDCTKVLFSDLNSDNLLETIKLMSVVDDKGRYLHWDDISKRIRVKEKAIAHWSLIKMARKGVLRQVPALGDAFQNITFFTLLPSMQKACSLIDRTCTEAGLNDLISRISIPGYYLDDFINEESIASSQLEGASTTHAVAKKMLLENRSGRNESEKMILGNRRLMTLAWESRFDEMSLALLLTFHEEATQGIDDDKYHPGKIRKTNDVWVGGRDGEVVHQPPDAEILGDLLDKYIKWINFSHDEGISPQDYLHPVVKACIMHFGLGFLHPFNDGNGRVARAMCYWYLFKHGYDAFIYISISQLLKEAPIQYGEAYMKTETDNQDVTYFVDYQCRVLERAVNGLIDHVRTVAGKLREFDTWVFTSGIRRKMPDIQQTIINMVVMAPGESFTVKSFAERAGVSEAASRIHLEKLAEVGILLKQGGGGSRPVHYLPKTSFDKMKKALMKLYA